MKKPKKPSVKITKSRAVLYGSVLLVAILAVSSVFYFRTSKQLCSGKARAFGIIKVLTSFINGIGGHEAVSGPFSP